ncbi:unnamed protein product [Allacma fusca]|uniref:Ig-like domain-containing protein n=1 Tax=Allacma fusca TaxID=39272 RepID=A0A8J2J2Z0_9HEXA|nr:unnamed protein product [Allacma fusca]
MDQMRASRDGLELNQKLKVILPYRQLWDRETIFVGIDHTQLPIPKRKALNRRVKYLRKYKDGRISARATNSLKGSRRNSANKINKSRRGWNLQPITSSSQAEEVKGPEVELTSGVSTGSFKSGVTNKQWLELEGIPPSRVPVRLHSDLTLECQAVGSPPPMIYWLKNGKPIDNQAASFSSEELANQVDRESNGIAYSVGEKSGFVMAKTKSKLPLRCIRPEDEAQYTCVADNDGRQLIASTVVVIEEDDPSGEMRPECEYKLAMFAFNKKVKRGTPAFILASETLHMESIGSDVVLPCRGAGRPRPKITWIDAEGQRIVSGKKFQVNSNGNLLIRNLSWNEMGEYSCVAENSFGNDLASTFLYPLMTEDS